MRYTKYLILFIFIHTFVFSAWAKDWDPNFILVSHRGIVTENAPENSVASLELSLKRGYTHIEADLRATRDGHVVVLHDRNLSRTLGHNANIDEITLDELRKIASPDRVPTFDEFCKRCQGRIALMPDLKGVPKELEPQYIQGIELAMNRYNLMNSALFISRDQILLDFFSRKGGRVCIRVPYEVAKERLKELENPGKTYFAFNHAIDFNSKEVDGFHTLGLQVVVSINLQHYRAPVDPIEQGLADVDAMLELGVDGLQLDSAYDKTVALFEDRFPVLRFNREKRFRIVQFTDTHWHEGDEKDYKTQNLFRIILEAEKPELVVLTGDILGGGPTEFPVHALKEIAKPMVERKIPWAYVFGNHDGEGKLSRQQLNHLSRSIPYSVSGCGPTGIMGVSNFWLPVLASGSEKQMATIYCIDSNTYEKDNHKNYDWIHTGQVEWYRQVSKRLTLNNHGIPIPALVFFHIPLMEFDDIWNSGNAIGQKHEKVCCPKVNSGLFAAMLEMGDVMAAYVGHDHINDFEGDWYGIRLGYGRASGYTPYARPNMPRGARIIELQEGEHNFKTWLRLVDGTVEKRSLH